MHIYIHIYGPIMDPYFCALLANLQSISVAEDLGATVTHHIQHPLQGQQCYVGDVLRQNHASISGQRCEGSQGEGTLNQKIQNEVSRAIFPTSESIVMTVWNLWSSFDPKQYQHFHSQKSSRTQNKRTQRKNARGSIQKFVCVALSSSPPPIKPLP